MTLQAETQALQATDTPTQEGKTIGRPTDYSPAVADMICARLADGELLTDICRHKGMPSRQAVHRWRMKYTAFNDQYLRAREIGMESMSDDLLIISDDDTGDLLPDGTPNGTNVQRARLMTDSRKFLMAKLAPRIYGDKVEHKHSGEVGHTIKLSDRERMRRLASFIDEDQRQGHTIDGQAIALPDSPALPAKPSTNESRPIDDRARSDDNV